MPHPSPIERQPVDRSALAVMVVLCLIWGTQQAAVKFAASAMSATLQMGVRSSVAALATIVLANARKDLPAMTRATLLPGIFAGLFFGMEFVLTGEALRYTSVSHVTVYLYSAPILIAVGLGLMHRDERLSPAQWLGVGVAFAGVAVTFLGRGDSGRYPAMYHGDALALTGAVSWALTAFVLRGSRLAHTPATITLLYQLLGAGILATGVAFAMGETTVRPSAGLAVALVWQITVVAFGSYLAWFTLLRRYSAARLGVLSFMTPVFGVAAGIVALGDRIDAGFALGAVMILGGIAIATTRWPRWRRETLGDIA